MSYDIGPKIGIDGEAEFRKQIQNINQNVRTLGTEMAVATSAFDKNDKSQAALSARAEVLTKQIDAQRDKVNALNDMLAKSAEKYGENDTRTLKWQAAVNSATADLNNMERSLSEVNDELDNQGWKFDGLKEKLSSFGSGVGKALEVGAKAIAGFATAATAAVTAVGSMAIDAAYAADEINTLSKQTGLSTEEIQKFQYASEQIDVPLDTLTGSMSKLTKNMATASKGTGDAYDAFKALGVEITDQNGELRDRNEVFNEAINALGTMENETQRDAYAMQIFGKSAQDLNPLILGGADALKELGAQAESAGLILEQDSLDKLNLVSDAVDTLKATASGAGNMFMVGFAEPIAQAVNLLTGYIQTLTSAFSENGVSGLTEALGTVLTDLVAKIQEYLPQVLQLGTEILLSLIRGIGEILPSIAETAATIITQLCDGLLACISELVPVAVDVIMTIVDTLIENIDNIVSTGVDILVALVDGLLAGLPDLIERVPEIIVQIVTTLANNLPKIIELAGRIIVALITGLINAIPELVKSLPKIVTAIVDGIGAAAKSIVNVGKNIVTGLWNGINSMVQWVKNKISGFVSNIIGGIKSLLGIHSPSRVFAGIGENMAAGLGTGWGDEIGAVSRQIDRSMSDLIPAVSGNVSLSSRALGGTTSGISAADLRSALSGVGVYMSGRKVGVLTTIEQSNMARARGAALVSG